MFKTDGQFNASAELPARRDSRRVDWVDRARGVGIILVILGHACGGIIDSPDGSQAPWLHFTYLTIYSFHMPLFFVLSGLFVASRVAANPKGFITSTGTRVVRPYFTWSAIQFTVIYLMSGLVNHPANGAYLPQLISLIWRPISQFWFLYALAFMQLVAFVLLPRLGATGFFILTFVVTVCYRVFLYVTHFEVAIVNQFFLYLMWFGLGTAVGPQLARLRIVHDTPPAYPLAAFATWLALLVVTYASYVVLAPHWHWDWLSKLPGDMLYRAALKWRFIPTALAGCTMISLICSAGLVPFGRFFDYLGRNSMPIFLTHVLFIAGTRIIALKLLPAMEPFLLMVLVSVAGLFGSLLFLNAARQLKVDKALALA